MTFAPRRARRRRHVWVSSTDDRLLPGLVVSWRRVDRGWQAQVAVLHGGSLLLRWVPAGELRPVADDGWGRRG